MKTPDWLIVENDRAVPIHYRNVFRLLLDNDQLGVGVVVNPESKQILVSLHVALLWERNCKRYKKCPKLTAINSNNDLNIPNVFDSPIIIKDYKHDLAVLVFKVKRSIRPMITLEMKRDSLPEVGEEVSIVSFIPDDGSMVLSPGKVMGTNYESRRKPSFGHDADTLPGMSGSPVFNSVGELIGIHFGRPRGDRFNKAIPISLMLDIMARADF